MTNIYQRIHWQKEAEEKEKKQHAAQCELEKLDDFLNAVAATSFSLNAGCGLKWQPDYELANEILKALTLKRVELQHKANGAR
jgi:hypothetical protein